MYNLKDPFINIVLKFKNKQLDTSDPIITDIIALIITDIIG